MGIVSVLINSISGAVADQYLDVITSSDMDSQTVLCLGRSKNQSRKSGDARQHLLRDGSIIYIGENQCMILVDGGRIVDYCAQPGYYEVDNQSAPSLLGGKYEHDIEKEITLRVQYAGNSPASMQVFFVNMQEIRNIPFGTPAPLNYFDAMYDAELRLRTHGYFSVRVMDPIKFYVEMNPHGENKVTVASLQKILMPDFLTAFQTAVGKFSLEGIRVAHLSAKQAALAETMNAIIDDAWLKRYGIVVESTSISTIVYDAASQNLVDRRNQKTMLSNK